MEDMKVIVMDIPRDHHYGRQVCEGIHRYARPYRPWLFTDIESREDSGMLRHAETVGMISMRQPHIYLAKTLRRRLPSVGVGMWAPTDEFRGLPYADVDPNAIGEMAAEYFIKRGFRNFGMVALDEPFHSRYRGEAFVAALRRRKITCHVFDYGKKHQKKGKSLPAVVGPGKRSQAYLWLMGLPKPSAVFCINDYVGLWLSSICWEANLHVPEDVAVLGADDDHLLCSMAYPHLSSITIPAEQVGFEAAELLDDMLHGKKPPKRHILLPPMGVITRQSTDIMAIEDSYVTRAVRFIRENAHRGIRVDSVLKEVRMSRRALEQRFHTTLNRSPFAEIRRVQIEHIKMLLTQTDKTLEAIAPECGFDDVTRMSMAFKKAVKMPPGAYRKQFHNQ